MGIYSKFMEGRTMAAYQGKIIERDEFKLVGYTLTESLNHILETGIVGKLREELVNRRNEVDNLKGSGIYLVQLYSCESQWTPDTPYQHVIGLEVAALGEVPDGMMTYTLAPGRFIKVVHQGPESRIGETYDFINKTYGVRSVDIEYWSDVKDMHREDTRIDIYFPAQ
jgi:predicted transcriptional regulator YdeE